uniref:Uncharacterized protein n=1 Tax=Tetradesmus obliquus TaxID=3088 RepID=A0A383VJ32_TETOB|eukprot:jgi/Sobl393_1/5460/SZX64386.1
MPLPVPNVLGLASLLRRRRTTRQQAAAGRQHWMTAPADPASSSRNATASSSTTTATTTTSRSSTSSSSSSTPWVVWYHPSMYWQQPRLRLSIIMCQRVLPPLFAALSVGYITPRFFELTSLRYWPMVGQYVFLGWKGFMLVLPLRLHLASSLAEWLLISSTALRVNSVYHGIPPASATSLQQLLASALFVLVLPAAGVMWLERGQRARYQQLQQRMAEAGQQEEEEEQQQGHEKESSSSSRHSSTNGASAGDDSAPVRQKQQQRQQQQPASARAQSSGNAPISIQTRQQPADVDASSAHAGSSTAAQQHGSSSSIAPAKRSSSKARRRHSEPPAASLGQQLMADITSSLQLAAAAPPLPAAAAAVREAAPSIPIIPTSPTAMTAAAAAAASPGKSAAAVSARGGDASALRAMQQRQFLDDTANNFGSSGFLECLEQLSATQQLDAAHDAATAAASQDDTFNNSSSRSSSGHSDWLMAEVHSGLAALLGSDAASAVLAAAAEAASGVGCGPRPGDMPFYTSLAATMPVSLKVHTAHSNVGALSPLLGSTLAGQLSPFSSAAAPLQLATACFPGCVQLLGNIIAVKPAAARGVGEGSWAAGSSSSGGGEAGLDIENEQGSSFALSLLDAVTRALKAAYKAGTATAGQLAAAEGLPAVDVAVGTAAASSAGDAAAAAAVSGKVVHPAHVALQWCSMACLAAGRQQTLHLQLTAPSEAAAAAAGGGSAGCCRLLAFNSSGVLLDETAQLQQALSVALPAQAAGLCHIALLPGLKPDTTTALGSSNTEAPSDAPGAAPSAAAAAPLLLLPLLVLPEESAAELQQAWQAAGATAAADMHLAPAGSTADDTDAGTPPAVGTAAADASDLAAAWSGAVASLTVDIAYVLSACSTTSGVPAAATAGSSSSSSSSADKLPTPLPAAVSAVLCNVLQHLAASGMFHTMQFLVDAATTATAATPDASSSRGRTGRVSSDGSDSSDGNDAELSGAATAAGTAAVSHNNLSRAGSSAAPAPSLGDNGGSSSSSNSSSRMDSCREWPAGSAATCSRTFGTWDSSKSCSSSTAAGADCAADAAAAADCGAAKPVDVSKPCSSSNIVVHASQAVPATLLQLLWGFVEPGLESRFMAATFSSSSTLDLFTALYNVAMGVGCWFAAGAKHCTPADIGVQLHRQQLFGADRSDQAAPQPAFAVGSCSWNAAVKQSGWNLMMIWSVAAVLVLNAGTSLAVWLLRLRVAAAVKRLRMQQQQQQQVASGGCSSKTLPVAAGEATTSPIAAAAAIKMLLAQAGATRQRLLALWIVHTAVLDVLCAVGAVVTPGMMVRAWGLGGWAQNAACVLGLGVKAWMYQVPFHWFVPLMTLEVATHAYASTVFSLQPFLWLAVPYGAALALAVAVAAAHNVLGRRLFWASQSREQH